jgi:hypothetical protein
MNPRKIILLLITALSCAGCSSIPFQQQQPVNMALVDPSSVRNDFAASLPSEFQLVSSIVFKYRFRSMSAIGLIDADIADDSFKVACINQVGLKLFEVVMSEDEFQCNFAIEQFTEKGDLPRAVAGDIKRIYFDRVPGPDSEIQKKKHEIIFRQPVEKGRLEYVFAGTDNRLVQKRRFEGRRKIWTVSYYEYFIENGKLHPAGIILNHHKHNYRLIARVKEVRS